MEHFPTLEEQKRKLIRGDVEIKRVGHLYEKMVTLDNCILAEQKMCRNKKDNHVAVQISKQTDKYGAMLYDKLKNGTYQFHESRERRILDSYKQKERKLLIPCLEDQAAEYAWMNIAEPYLMKHFYYYSCASIPNAGQTRAVKALKRWLRKTDYKYGAVCDIHHFYETLNHDLVIHGLRRIFKDEKFIAFAKEIMDSMSLNGVGIAIGHPISHWLANVALTELDTQLLGKYHRKLKFVRYMDDMAFLSNNKRELRHALEDIRNYLSPYNMELKNTWQVFQIEKRGVQFLSYRFFRRKTILTKRLMYRIARKMKRFPKHKSLLMAQGIMSYNGILKHCDSYNFKQCRVYPYVKIRECRRIIKRYAKKKNGTLLRAA